MFNFIFYFFYSLTLRKSLNFSDKERRLKGVIHFSVIVFFYFMIALNSVELAGNRCESLVNHFMQICSPYYIGNCLGFMFIITTAWLLYKYYSPTRIENVKKNYEGKNIFSTARVIAIISIYLIIPLIVPFVLAKIHLHINIHPHP
ncbi:MAG: hypothetical protein RJA07_681 [Bacteroidota bacterium]|jgi:hypothetical protein